MKVHLFMIFVSITITLVARVNHAASPSLARLYWNSVLGETPMPKALSELIQPDEVRSAQPFDGYTRYYDEDKLLVYYNHGGGTHSAILEDPTQVVFFFEEKVHPGTTMKLSLARNTTTSTFLTKKLAESIPFSVSKLPEILNRFGVKPGSSEAHIMKETLETCEGKVVKGEDKHCATSLESMVDFATFKLGISVRAISTEVENGATLVQKGATLRNYTITSGVTELANADADKLIVCHRLGYGYAVFYCHTFGQTRAYVVPLQALDRTKAKAVAICHVDTSEWNPKNFALLVLKVKPGTVPVCHFLPEGHVAWVANQKST